MTAKHEITRDDIMAMDDYAAERRERRAEAVALKRNRRMEVGPVAAFYFESYATMWHQVHEMLHIERGGDAQIADELAAYNPLIPKGRELVATVMFEVDDEVRRRNFLSRLGGVEETAFLRFDGEKIAGAPEADLDRTTADGKASAVQFIHFPFNDGQVEKFRAPGTEVIIGFDHPNYAHMAVMSEAVRAALAEDFD
ncbi:MAG: DUF3501 family protein [Alphaproteobacteria bacterium]|nr:DUF3501 family protein [Alphaproteobacteria bacterium]